MLAFVAACIPYLIAAVAWICWPSSQSAPPTHLNVIIDVVPPTLPAEPVAPILSRPRTVGGRTVRMATAPAGFVSEWDRLVNDLLGRPSVDQLLRAVRYPSGTAMALSSWDS